MNLSYSGYATNLIQQIRSTSEPTTHCWFGEFETELGLLEPAIVSETLEILRCFLAAGTLKPTDNSTLSNAFFAHYTVFWFSAQGRVGLSLTPVNKSTSAFETLLNEVLEACRSPRKADEIMSWLKAECERDGSIFVSRLSRSALYRHDEPQAVLDALKSTFSKKKHACLTYVPETQTLFLPKHVALILHETNLIRRRVEHNRENSSFTYDTLKANIDFTSDPGFSLNEDQQTAVIKALSQKITIISGGPGTGKTSIIKRILKEAVQTQRIISDYSEVRLTAPTGKAAQRMTDSLTDPNHAFETIYPKLEKPCTIHRLLKIGQENEPRFNASRPLPAKLIIVDEISMIGLELGCMLLDAIAGDAHLILLGDPDQLPPVESGSLLNTLMPNASRDALLGSLWRTELPNCHVKLHQNYRSKSQPQIYATQNGVISGERIEAKPTEPEALHLSSFEWCQTPEKTAAILNIWVECLKGKDKRWLDNLTDENYKAREREHFNAFAKIFCAKNRAWQTIDSESSQSRLKAVFDHFERFRILTPMNTGRFGAEMLNRYVIRELFSSKDRSYGLPVGTLVMLTKSNYEIKHYNGDTGIIVFKDRKPHVAFPSMKEGVFFDVFPLAPYRSQLIPAFAISVHKSQGSQYPHVMIVLPPKAPNSLMSRNLLYTAISRASQSVLLLSSEESADQCVDNASEQDPFL